MFQVSLHQLRELIQHAWEIYKFYDLLIIALGVIAFHLLSKRLKELKEITDEFEEKFRKRTDLLLSRVAEAEVEASAHRGDTDVDLDATPSSATTLRGSESGSTPPDPQSQEDRWQQISARWDDTARDLNRLVEKARAETTDGRKRKPYERLDGRSMSNVILTLYDGDWIGERAATVALDIVTLFNSFRNRRSMITEQDAERMDVLASEWARLRDNGYKELVVARASQAAKQANSVASSDLGKFRNEFWQFYLKHFPDGTIPSYASSRWEPAGKFIVAQYISRRGVGVFIRGQRGSTPTQTTRALKPYVEQLERKLSAPFNNGRYAFHVFFPTDTENRSNWLSMAAWLNEKTETYKKALGDVSR